MSLFRDYINQRPFIINDENKLMGLVKDSLSISEVKYASSIEYAFNENILLALKKEYPLSKDKYDSFISLLIKKYTITQEKAEFALNFWISGLKDFNFKYFNPTAKEKYPICNLAGPTITSARANSSKNEISLQWKGDTDVEKYLIYRSKDSSQIELLTEDFFPCPRYTDKNLESGSLYHYYLRSLFKDNTISQMSSSIELILPNELKRIQINEIRFIDSNIKISWKLSLDSQKIIIKRKNSSDNSWKNLQVLDGGKFNYIDKDILFGAYSYKLEIFDNNNTKYNTTPITINIAKRS